MGIMKTETVEMRGGPTVPLAALALLLELESQAFRMSLKAGKLSIQPASKLTAKLTDDIKAYKMPLMKLVAYVEGECERQQTAGTPQQSSLGG